MSMEEESTHIDDDYYAFLNVDRNATQDELTKAYRRLSRLFHPDKHGDTDSQKAAETLFNKAQKAYEVLSNPQKRAIYDALGTKGLESDTWAVISRNKTPQEIREEFERLQKEKENYLRALTSPQGVIVVGINAIELFDNYADHESLLPNIEVSSLSVQQAVDLPLSRGNTATINAALDIDRGNGTGSIGTGLKRVFSDQSWGEFQYAAGQGPVVTLKYFRRIFRRSFFSVNGFTHITPLGIVPGTELVLGKHLSRHTVGTITWKPFPHSFMNTTITRNKNQQQVEAQVQLGVPTCFAKVSYSRSLDIGDSTRVRGAVMIGTLGYTLEYGCQTKISQHVVVGAAMEIGVPRGVTLRLKLHRANQTYLFSILLAEEVLPSAIFYGTVVPLFTFYCVKTLIIEPHKKRESELHLRKVQQENATKLEKAKAEAKAAVQLMTKTYERILHQETSLSGLVILKAFYGNALDLSDLSDLTELINKTEVIEVTIQLQCLIKDSCLILTPSSKASLPGIYDPCFGKEKKLRIEYKFRDRLHAVTINDEDSLRLPDPVHIV